MELQDSLAVIILAAGKGTRMKSALPKVMHPVAGQPMVKWVIGIAEGLKPQKIVVVTAPGMESVATAVSPHATAVQKEQLGTAHAVLSAKGALADFQGTILVLYGDGPLYTRETALNFLKDFEGDKGAGVSFLAMEPEDPFGYGRLKTDSQGHVTSIVEEKDASAEERKIRLCWTGIMAAKGGRFFDWLSRIDNKNAKGEYYLTDLPAVAAGDGIKTRFSLAPFEETLGANTREELSALEEKMQKRLRRKAMENGATLIDPETVYFSHDTVLGTDVVVEPNVWFGPKVVVANNAVIHAFSHLEGVRIEEGVSVGPFARLRPGTHLKAGSRIGNFVEVKNSVIEQGSKANHLAYIGDSEVGVKTNIGAGTITCNYDGYDKHKTVIGDGVFVGSNSTLVAPVQISDGAYIGAGSVVTHDVPKDSLLVARARSIIKEGWAALYRVRKKK
jgi:bifunctional UDP-N-acetylglucosamine pyrophosphorylase/glucosamine-1-phosphate N-acetyltransferase